MKQLIISITENYYKKAIEYRLDAPTMIVEAIRHGTPLDDVLDKIRAEIEQIEINGYIRDVECFTAGINTALNVINKYRKER